MSSLRTTLEISPTIFYHTNDVTFGGTFKNAFNDQIVIVKNKRFLQLGT